MTNSLRLMPPAVVEDDRLDENGMLRPEELASDQVDAARELLRRDLRRAPRWAWPEVDALLGPALPGDLLVVGALTGNGKSTLLMSQMDHLSAAKVPTLYVPLEVDPEVCRLRWAAWKLDFDQRAVVRQDWARLPEGAREAVENMLEEQVLNPYMHFATPRRMTWAVLVKWCRWATDRSGVRVVMIDHFHRLDFGQGASFRVDVTEVARALKDLARELGVTIIAAAQLNRSSDPVDQYLAPHVSRLKESGGIGEEADVIVMLSRRLRSSLPKNWTRDLKLGRLTENDVAQPNMMLVTCRKHRLDPDALNQNVTLRVENGQLQSVRRYAPDAAERFL